jgi:tetratricopeptide (TPR) repeat protein
MTDQRPAVRRFNWTFALVLVMGMVVLGASAVGARYWRRQYLATNALEKGLAAYKTRDWATAAQEIGRYCAVHDSDESALLKYAEAQLHVQPQKRGNVDQAIGAYRQVLRLNPAHAEALERLAEVYLQTGLPSEAELTLRRWLEAEDAPRAHFLLSLALEAQKKSKEAGEELQRTIDTHPENIAAYQQLARLMLQHPAEVPGQALDLLKLGVERNPSSAEAHVALGTFLQQSGGSEEARKQAQDEYAKALACDLSNVQLRIFLASRLMSVGDLERAGEQLARAAESDPYSLELWKTWAALAGAKGSPEEANAVARRGLEALGSEAYPFLETAADLFLYGNNEPEAESCLQRIEQLDPVSPAIPALRGKLADCRGNPREAIRQWQKALAPGASSPQLRLLMARAYERAGDAQAAVRELRRVVSQLPRLAPAQFLLASALGRVGSWREAAACASEAVRLDPTNLDARALDLELRARMAVAQGQPSPASAGQLQAEAEGLLQQRPDSLNLLSAAGDVALFLRNLDRAGEVAKTLQGRGSKLQGALLEVRVLLARADEGRARADEERARGDGERARADEEQARADEEQALARLQAAVADFPGETVVVLNLANLLLAQKRTDEAVKVIESGVAAQQGKGGQGLRQALASLHYRLGHTAEAQQILKQLCDENPEDLSSRVMLLNVVGPKDAAQAQQLVEEMKRIEGPDGLQWRFQQARLWLSSPDWKTHTAEALDLLNANLRADPGDLQSQLLLGLAQEKAGNLRLAIEAYRRAYQQAPTAPVTIVRLIGALSKAHELDEASRVLDDAAGRGVSAERIAGLRLELQQQAGQLDEAGATAEEMLARDPENLALKTYVATIKMRQGKLDDARKILEALDQTNPLVMTAKVDLFLREKKVPEALALCDQLVASTNAASAYLFRGRIRAVVGELDLAEADYRKVTELEPKNVTNWLAYADFLALARKLGDATQAVKQALSLTGDNPAVIAKAVALFSLSTDASLHREADDLLKRGLAAHPGDPVLSQVEAGRLLSPPSREKVEQARQLLDRVTRDDPRQVGAWVLLARCALLQQLPDAALDAVSRGLAAGASDAQRRDLRLLKAQAEEIRWPALAATTLSGLWSENKKDTDVGLALARTYRDAGDSRKAITVLNEMWSEDHARLDVGLPLAEAYRDASQTREALAVLEGMKSLVSGRELDGVNLALADTLDLDGRTEEGLQLARSTAETSPDEPRAIPALVQILVRRERWNEVYAELAKWQKEHPADIGSLLVSTQILLAAGEGTGATAGPAAEIAKKVLQELVVDPPKDLAVKQSLAALYQAAGLAAEAEKVYREVLQEQPENARVLNNLAWLLSADKNRYEEALALVSKAVERYPQFANAVDTRGVIYHRMGRLKEARADLEACISQSPEGLLLRSEAEFHLAQVLRDQGESAQAAVLLGRCLARPKARGGLPDAERLQAENLRSELTAPASAGGR